MLFTSSQSICLLSRACVLALVAESPSQTEWVRPLVSGRALAGEGGGTRRHTSVAPPLGSDSSFCQGLPTTQNTTWPLTHTAPPTVLSKYRHPHLCPWAPGGGRMCNSPSNLVAPCLESGLIKLSAEPGVSAALSAPPLGTEQRAGLPHTPCFEVSVSRPLWTPAVLVY